jgi:hypothetical protein
VLREQEVLDGLAAAGFPTPPTRFENWRERGLVVPCGSRRGLGQAKGRVAHLYPDGTIEQAIEIAQMRRQNLDLDEIGWRLWVAGRQVERKCWFPVFEVAAAEFDASASEFREALDSDDLDENPIDELAKTALAAKTHDPLFRQVRKSLGPDRLSAILLHVASMAVGEFVSVSTQTEELSKDQDGSISAQMQDPRIKERQADLRAMDVALGLGRARTDTVVGVGPIIVGDYSSIIRETFAPLANTTLTEFLASVDSEHLRGTTRDLSAFAQSLAAASQEFDRTLAKDAFGFRRAALLARSDRMRQAQTGLMWALILEKSAEKFHDLSAMTQRFDAAAKLVREHQDLLKNSRPNFQRQPKKPIK